MFGVLKESIQNYSMNGSLNDKYDSVSAWIETEKESMSISDFEYEYLGEMLEELVSK